MSDADRHSDEIAEFLVHIARAARGEDGAAPLTAAQWTALRFFARAHSASRTPSAFASFQATTRGTASQTIKALVARGLLTRHRSDRDGRSVRFEVTVAGEAMLRRDPLRDLTGALDRLEPATRRALMHTLATLAADLASCRGTRCFGTCDACAHYAARPGGGGYCACVAADLMPDEIGRLCGSFAPAAANPAQPPAPAHPAGDISADQRKDTAR